MDEEMLDNIFKKNIEETLLNEAREGNDQLLTAAVLVLRSTNKPSRVVVWEVEFGDNYGINSMYSVKKSMEESGILKENEILDVIVGSLEFGSLKIHTILTNQMQ